MESVKIVLPERQSEAFMALKRITRLIYHKNTNVFEFKHDIWECNRIEILKILSNFDYYII